MLLTFSASDEISEISSVVSKLPLTVLFCAGCDEHDTEAKTIDNTANIFFLILISKR
jgi:hypothetical protein